MPTKKQELPFDGYKWLSKFAAKEDSRPVLHTVYIDGGNKAGYTCERVAIATDGYRMAILPVPQDTALGFIPIAGDNTPSEAWEACIYPAWDKIVPSDVPFELTLNTSDLLAALKRGRGMGDCVYLLWELDTIGANDGQGTLHLYFPGPGKDKAVCSLPAMITKGAETVTFHGAKIGCIHTNNRLNAVVNTQYLITSLEGWKDIYTTIGFAANNKMITVAPLGGPAFNNPLTMIMLMRPEFDRSSNMPTFIKAWQEI